MKLLIADSGNTKTDWAYLEDGKPIFHRGAGLHPAFNSDEAIRDEIQKTVAHVKPNAIRFYGTGCYSEQVKARFGSLFRSIFPSAHPEVFDDLLGAARAHLGSTPGLIAILGTGSVCGRFNGHKVTERAAALGYAIGDEGSASHLGRQIMKGFFRRQFDNETSDLISDALNNQTYPEVMDRIYRSANPGHQLAAIAGEVLNRPLSDQLANLVTTSMKDFVTGQLSVLHPQPDEKVVFTGTVARRHNELLENLMQDNGFTNFAIGGSVIEGLIQFYNKNEDTG